VHQVGFITHNRSPIIKPIWLVLFGRTITVFFSKTFKIVCGQIAGFFLMFQHHCCCCLLSLSTLLCLFLLYIHTSLHAVNKTLKIVSPLPDITATCLTLILFIQEVLGSILSPETICSEVFVVFLSPFRKSLCST
jgi:hypothetical protein